MTQAADDFALIKQACDEQAKFGLPFPNDITGQQIKVAFNRLFTPRPLRELFDQGFRFCWAWHPRAAREPLYFDMRSNRSEDFVGTWAEMVAVPILRPEDMGITP